MSDSTINVSGSDQAYAVDAVRLGGSGDYRQVVVLGDHTTSGIAGAAATVAASALHVSAVGGTVTANLGATDNAVLDSIKVDTEAIETAVEGVLDVAVVPSKDAYLSHVYIDLDGTGDNPTPSTTRILAVHALATTAGSYSIKGQRQITNKTAEGTAIKFQVAANEATDIYMGELGVPVYGVVSVSGPTDGCVLTAFVG